MVREMSQSDETRSKSRDTLTDKIDIKEYKTFTKNFTFFHLKYDDFKREYPNEYVAIDNSSVVDHDKNAKVLIQRLKEKWGDLGAFVIEYISPSRVELIL